MSIPMLPRLTQCGNSMCPISYVASLPARLHTLKGMSCSWLFVITSPPSMGADCAEYCIRVKEIEERIKLFRALTI